MNSKRALSMLFIGILVVAGCSSSGSSPSTSAAASANPTTPPVSAAPPSPAASAPSASASGATASSSAAAVAGCPIATPPAGSDKTSISTWVDPRPCAWAQTYPAFAAATVGDGSLQRLQSKGEIKVCAETDIKPIVYADPKTGTVTGFEPEILQELAKRLGIAKVTFVNIPFVSYIPALQAHKCDIVMGGIAVTSERSKAPGIKYAFPYFRFADVIIVKADSPYQKVEDLTGKKFASITGSIEDTITKQIVDRLGGGTSVQEYTAIDNAYTAVLNDTDQAFIDLGATFKLHPSGDKLRALPGLLAGPTDPASPYYPSSGAPITASADGDINAAFAAGVESMIQDGSLQQILTKWGIYQSGITDFIRPDA
jgi:ABC-type amino acid transport substrate-binding protein